MRAGKEAASGDTKAVSNPLQTRVRIRKHQAIEIALDADAFTADGMVSLALIPTGGSADSGFVGLSEQPIGQASLRFEMETPSYVE